MEQSELSAAPIKIHHHLPEDSPAGVQTGRAPGWKWFLWLGAPLVVAAGLKAGLILFNSLPFNADEAVVALMGRHILAGARPTFFYGQAYMGSLDAYLVAAGFSLFGQQVWVIRLIQTLLYLATLASLAPLGKAVFGSWRVGLLAVWLMAVPTVNVTLYTTVSLGGYGEALLLGNLILLANLGLGRRLQAGDWGPLLGWAWLGFLVGLGLWAFGLTLLYSLPAAIYLAWLFLRTHHSRLGSLSQFAAPILGRSLGVLAGFIVGAWPWFSYAISHGFGTLLGELGGSAIVQTTPWIIQVGQHLLGLSLLGLTVILGMRPPWGVKLLALPLMPLALAFWAAALSFSLRQLRRSNPVHGPAWLLAGVGLALIVAMIFTPFGTDSSGRYFLPLAPVMALFGAALIDRLVTRYGSRAYLLVSLALAFNLWGILQCASTNPPGITTQFYEPAQVDQRATGQLIEFLQAQGEGYGYTNYWVAYPLAFHSQETLIFIPRLPYHPDFRYTTRDDRYLPYQEMVAQAGRAAYITTRNHPLDEYLRRRFAEKGVTWQEAQIGEFQVFYALSRKLTPQEIGLGGTVQ